jgi:hypothetical protein
MAKPYSEDLRRRVVGAIEGGATIPEAAEQCGVSISSVVRFLKLHRETGSIGWAKFGGYMDFALRSIHDFPAPDRSQPPKLAQEHGPRNQTGKT